MSRPGLVHVAQMKIPQKQMGVSKTNGTPKSSILIWFSIINHPFWGPLFLETSKSVRQVDHFIDGGELPVVLWGDHR